MRSTDRRRGSIVILVTMVSLVGCSGEKPPPPPPPQVTKAPPAPPAPNRMQKQPPQDGPQQPGGRRVSKATPARPANDSLPEGVDPHDIFVALPEDHGNFAIVGESGASGGKDWFVAVRPAAGADSSSFFVIPPDGLRAKRPRAKNAALPEGFVADESAGMTPGTTADGWPERIRCEADDAEMVFVPGDVFLMGTEGLKGVKKGDAAH